MQKVVEDCTKSRADRPVSLQESRTLTSIMERPDKERAIEEHRRRNISEMQNPMYNFVENNLLHKALPLRLNLTSRSDIQVNTVWS